MCQELAPWRLPLQGHSWQPPVPNLRWDGWAALPCKGSVLQGPAAPATCGAIVHGWLGKQDQKPQNARERGGQPSSGEQQGWNPRVLLPLEQSEEYRSGKKGTKGSILLRKGEPEHIDPWSDFAQYAGGFTTGLSLLILLNFFVKKHRIQLKLTGIFRNKSTCKLVCGAHWFTRKRLHSPKVLLGYACRGLVRCCQAPPRVFPVL